MVMIKKKVTKTEFGKTKCTLKTLEKNISEPKNEKP